MDRKKKEKITDKVVKSEPERERVTIRISYDTHKRLKLISIVEDRSTAEILDDIVRERYGIRQKEIETLIKLAGNPTKVV